ncbi:hypothetical protein [Hymenobacter jejuensis]|uniref:Uncharacterized protein n=1 Tax=Hymenobacter jejuensis TaxID=2502781 RepID=A0A5B8A2Y0_9BACT|nr:hypothetical protein [Hymenobacter jejuensis]QDA60943.1 hypothetical protein FHG12_12885 [Hymenobacter jejuensis]
MKQILFLVLLLTLSTGSVRWSVAQNHPTPTQPARAELALQTYNSDVQVHPLLEDSSVVLLVDRDPYSSSRNHYFFQKFDSQLRQRWETPLEVPQEFRLVRTTFEGTSVYALFQSEYSARRLLVATLNGRTGMVHTTTFDMKNSRGMTDTRDLYDVKALDGNLFVTVLLERHMTVLLLDLQHNEYRFLPSVYEEIPTNFTFLADSTSKRAKFVMSQSNGLKSRLLVKQLSDKGTLLHSEYVQAESERGLLTAQISPGEDDQRLLTGTYTLRDSRYSQGLFAADLAAGTSPTGGRPSLRFYDFLNLKHFFDYMKPAREARLRQRGERLRATERQLRLHFRLMIHDLVPFQNGYVMVAEVYYPRYRYDGYGYSNSYSYGYTYPYSTMGPSLRRFEGYYSSHAIVCGFDKKGNLLWDNTFVLKDNSHGDLEETVRLRPMPDGKRLVLAYMEDNKIHYKIVDHTTSSPNDLEVPVQTSSIGTKEKANNASQEGLLPWYGSRFLAFGYQHVHADRGSDRDVFFLNSVAFD